MKGRNGYGNLDNNSMLGPGEAGIDPEQAHRTYVHRADDYTTNSLNSFSFGNATTSKPQVDVVVDNYDIGEPDDEAGEELEGEASPTVTTVDVTPRPSVAPTHPDALVYPYRHPQSRPSSSAEADSGSNSPTSVLAKSASVSSSSARGAHISRALPGRYSSNGREDVEFSSDDDSYEFDNIDYSEGDDGEDNIEISSARFSMTSGG